MRAITVALGVPMSPAEIDAALLLMDENGDNQIEFEEFQRWWLLQTKDGEGMTLLLLARSRGSHG